MSKKIISLLLTLLMLICASAVIAGAEDTASITLEGETYDIPVGGTFTVETKLTMPNAAAAGGRVIWQFDTSVIQAVGVNGAIYDTDLGSVMSVGGYTADGAGCSFAFAATEYSDSNILDGDKDTLARFLFNVKAAGSTELVFDSSSFEYSVFTSADSSAPLKVVSAGSTVGDTGSYNFKGNVLTVGDFEYEDQTEPPASEENSDNSETPSNGNVQNDSGLNFNVDGNGASVSGGDSGASSIKIPETTTDANGNSVPVTSISDGAFLDYAAKEIYIPASVTKIPEHSVGYRLENGEYVKIDGFKIYGHKGSAAEAYAKANGFTFIDADENPLDASTDSDKNSGGKPEASGGFPTVTVIIIVVAVIAVIGVIVAVILKKKKK